MTWALMETNFPAVETLLGYKHDLWRVSPSEEEMEVLLVGRGRDEDLEDGRDTAAVTAAEAIAYSLL